MKVPLPQLYAIIDRATLDARGIPVSAYAHQLAQADVRLVQYRDKHNGPQEILRAAEQIASAFTGTGATFILNDRADLAALLDWGVHVGQGDLSVGDVRKVLAPPATVGISTHTAEEVEAATTSAADYIAIGPVFATATKQDAAPVVGLEGVRHAKALLEESGSNRPLVAIGGITLTNARSVLDAGADSLAVITGLFVEGLTITEAARQFLQL